MSYQNEVNEYDEITTSKRNFGLIAGLLLLILVGGLIYSNIAKSNQTIVLETKALPENLKVEQIVSNNLEAGAYYYKPTTLTAKLGDKVKIVMKSNDMMHDFNIDELGVKTPIAKAGETVEIEFLASKTGIFEYYCSVGDHRAKGQKGTITITE